MTATFKHMTSFKKEMTYNSTSTMSLSTE